MGLTGASRSSFVGLKGFSVSRAVAAGVMDTMGAAGNSFTGSGIRGERSPLLGIRLALSGSGG